MSEAVQKERVIVGLVPIEWKPMWTSFLKERDNVRSLTSSISKCIMWYLNDREFYDYQTIKAKQEN
jgi:hypothetical protein